MAQTLRALTENERAVLAHVEHLPDLWWKIASEANLHITAEEALAAKVERYQAEYDAAKGEPGYQTRLERDIADPDVPHLNSEEDA